METTKVFGIQEKDFYQFIKKINEFYITHRVFATQTHNKNGTSFAVIYFDVQGKRAVLTIPDKGQETPFDRSHAVQTVHSPAFLSPKQKNVLLKAKYSEEDIKKMTQKEANDILDNILGKRFKQNKQNFDKTYGK